MSAVGQASTPILLTPQALSRGVTPLDGNWQFHIGDDPAWAKTDVNDMDGRAGWETVQTGLGWGSQGHYSYTGYAWYRKHIQQHEILGTSLAVMLPLVQDAYEVYWNGKLVGKDGRFPPHPIYYERRLARTVALGTVGRTDEESLLAIRVWKAPLGSLDRGTLGGLAVTPTIGSQESVTASKDSSDLEWLRKSLSTLALNLVYVLVAIISLLLWLRDRRQWLLFWMAGFSIGTMSTYVLFLYPLDAPFHLVMAPGQPLIGITNVSLFYLLIILLELNDSSRLMRVMRIVATAEIALNVAVGLLVLLNWPEGWVRTIQICTAAAEGTSCLLEFCPLILVAIAIERGRKLQAYRWLVALFALTTSMFDTVGLASMFGSRFTHWTLIDTMGLPLFMAAGYPITFDELSSTLLFVSIVYAIGRYSAESNRRNARLENEFHNAREVQRILIPEELPGITGYELTSAYRPSSEVGGDFFQVISKEDGKTIVVLGDVSGKGLRAAMAVSLIVGAIRTFAENEDSPAEILVGLNRRLHGRLGGGFATAIALRLEADGVCVVASAGHTFPFIDDQEVELPGALPLGVIPLAEYQETKIQLGICEHLALYTDGLLEARSRTGELYGFGRIKTLFAGRPTAEQASGAAIAFGQDDDITVLTLARATADAPELSTRAGQTVPA